MRGAKGGFILKEEFLFWEPGIFLSGVSFSSDEVLPPGQSCFMTEDLLDS